MLIFGFANPKYKIDIETEAFFSIPKLAKFLNISKTDVRRLLEEGELPFFDLGGTVIIAKSDVEDYLNLHRAYSKQHREVNVRIDNMINLKDKLEKGDIKDFI